MTVETGTRLNDRYRLESRIATGGMGEVWRARDELLDRDVAVKMLKHEYADDESFLERFRAEARHTAGLAHPGIAGVFDYGEAEGTAYLVMELVPGDPLNAVLREGRLTPDRTLDLVAQVARALDIAHQGGVIHRDVKPGNILVCPDGTVKVTDFGIARAADAVPLTQTGVVMGSAHYIAPEQASGTEVTYASDVYSLGVVAYECLAGHRPFDADTPVGLAMAHMYEDPVALPEDVPASVSQLVAQAMAKEPGDRFVSAAAFAQAADAVRSGLLGATQAMPAVGAAAPMNATMALPVVDDAPAPVVREERRRPAWLVAAVLGGLALILAVAGWAAMRPAPEATVPSLRGMTKAQATAALDRRDLDLTTEVAYHDTVERGLVIKQDPAPGATVREGDDVSVTISRGPQPVSLPDGLSGKPVDEVARTLEGLGLKVRRIGAVSEAPFGTVLSVAPGSGLRKGDTATVTFSFGPPRQEEPKGEGKKKGDKGDD
ncbi:MAG TPA: protein kinase [Frankiaceae bacterium]|nr:protein kinase [Frankiaceae bacterium]